VVLELEKGSVSNWGLKSILVEVIKKNVQRWWSLGFQSSSFHGYHQEIPVWRGKWHHIFLCQKWNLST